jgi:hypothetical protein
MTKTEIGEVYEQLIFKKQREPLTVDDQNLLRDCEIALGKVESEPATRKEAHARVEQAAARRRGTPSPSVRPRPETT